MTASSLRKLAFPLLFAIFFFAGSVSAQERSYHYEKIDITADVREDSTVEIEEKQTYKFVGEYHEGYRSIPHKALGAITDIRVFDAESGKEFEYASSELERTDSSSWGKYTYYESDGETVISWYFDAKDTTHTWTLRYVVHGALGFYKDHDELYWNAFTDYEVPVDAVNVLVRTPGAVVAPQMSFYTEPELPYVQDQVGDNQFIFAVAQVPPMAKVTFAVGWQKGLIDQRAYWIDFIKLNALYFYALLIVLASIVYALIYEWQWRKQVHGKGTIIPQYEPPENLQPAEAEMIVKRYPSDKAWAATIVDLAVRGYVTIKAEKPKWAWGSVFVVAVFGLLLLCGGLFLSMSVFPVTQGLSEILRVALPIIIIFSAVLLLRSMVGSLSKLSTEGKSNFFTIQDYTVTRTDKSDTDLEEYEKKYLDAIMDGGKFETAVMRKSQSKGQELYQKMQKVKNVLQDGMQEETGAYARPPGGFVGSFTDDKFANMKLSLRGILIVIFLVSSPALVPVLITLNPIRGLFWVAGAIGFAVLLIAYIWYWKVRLNTRGEILREEWLGFKLYLEKAEQYRLQKLTPETFEKFLPYAIIFGVEKEWGRAFSSISMPPPRWYSSSSTASFSSGSSFSASAFSTAFSASFASSISSSGGGGSGGGGGAGGGGGGGGGGAR